jgi:hypothetical protein
LRRGKTDGRKEKRDEGQETGDGRKGKVRRETQGDKKSEKVTFHQ